MSQKKETRLMKQGQVDHGARRDVRLFRNNVGQAWQGRRLKYQPGQFHKVERGDVILSEARPVEFGLAVGSGDLIGRGGLEEVAAGPGADGLADLGLVFEHGENDDAAVWGVLMDFAKDIQSTTTRQADVEKQHLGFFVAHGEGGEHAFRIGKRTRGSEATPGRAEAFEAAAEGVVIFDKPDLDGIGVAHSGRVRVMRVPWPGWLRMWSSPCSVAARSRRLDRP